MCAGVYLPAFFLSLGRSSHFYCRSTFQNVLRIVLIKFGLLSVLPFSRRTKFSIKPNSIHTHTAFCLSILLSPNFYPTNSECYHFETTTRSFEIAGQINCKWQFAAPVAFQRSHPDHKNVVSSALPRTLRILPATLASTLVLSFENSNISSSLRALLLVFV